MKAGAINYLETQDPMSETATNPQKEGDDEHPAV